jgi:proteic killer suppression protein
VIKSFFNKGTEDIFDYRESKDARRTCPKGLWPIAQRKLDQLNAVVSLSSLRLPPGNRLEPLKEDRIGQYSIRINDQFRICFVWTKDGPERVDMESECIPAGAELVSELQ